MSLHPLKNTLPLLGREHLEQSTYRQAYRFRNQDLQASTSQEICADHFEPAPDDRQLAFVPLEVRKLPSLGLTANAVQLSVPGFADRGFSTECGILSLPVRLTEGTFLATGVQRIAIRVNAIGKHSSALPATLPPNARLTGRRISWLQRAAKTLELAH